MLKLIAGFIAVVVLLSASLIMAFPTVHYSENIQQDWTFFMDQYQYEYASVVDFTYVSIDEVIAGPDPGPSQFIDQLHWGHSTPALMPLPTDDLLRARLYIGGVWVSLDGRETAFEGLFGWDPTSRQFVDNSGNWASGSSQVVNWVDGALNVELDAGDGYIRVDQAVFMVDYQDASAVPEPATIALLILGLIGIGLIQLRRRRIENVS